MTFEPYEPPTTARLVRTIDALTGEVLDWQSSCAELAEEKRALAVQCEALRDQVAELSIRADELSCEVDEWVSECNWLKSQLTAVTDERDELLCKVCTLRAERDEHAAAAYSLHAQIQSGGA